MMLTSCCSCKKKNCATFEAKISLNSKFLKIQTHLNDKQDNMDNSNKRQNVDLSQLLEYWGIGKEKKILHDFQLRLHTSQAAKRGQTMQPNNTCDEYFVENNPLVPILRI